MNVYLRLRRWCDVIGRGDRDARPWWPARSRAARRGGTSATLSRLAARCVPLTCSSDGRTHYVDDEVFAGAFDRTVGLCGHAVVVAALVAPLGPTCPTCLEAAPDDDAPDGAATADAPARDAG